MKTALLLIVTIVSFSGPRVTTETTTPCYYSGYTIIEYGKGVTNCGDTIVVVPISKRKVIYQATIEGEIVNGKLSKVDGQIAFTGAHLYLKFGGAAYAYSIVSYSKLDGILFAENANEKIAIQFFDKYIRVWLNPKDKRNYKAIEIGFHLSDIQTYED